MKVYRVFAALLVLVLASVACQALGGGGGSGESDEPSSNPETGNDGGDTEVVSVFPMTKDAFNVTEFGENNFLYYTKMSMDDVMEFYRDEYTSMGYEEREILTVVTDTTFNMVFDGDPSGMAVVIQSVDLGDGSRTITIRLEDV